LIRPLPFVSVDAIGVGVYGLARWLTGNSTDAEDVVQDACLRAFRGISGIREGNARAWVLTIVRHRAVPKHSV